MPDQTFTFTGHGRVKVFDPVWKCIYCGEDQGEFTDEHIIPQALGGIMILPKASCPSCQKIINEEVERHVLHSVTGTYSPARAGLRLPSKKRGKAKQPRREPFLKITDSFGNSRTIDSLGSDFPLAFTNVILGPPGMFIGRALSASVVARTVVQYDHEAMSKYAKPGENIEGLAYLNSHLLLRFIAKVAHGLAVAVHGIDGFKSFLPETILGKTKGLHPAHFIGSQEVPEPDFNGLHQFSVFLGIPEPFTYPGGDKYVSAFVRLFCRFATPQYLVIVGERAEQKRPPA